MKILYVHQHFATRSGSVGTRSYEFGRILCQRSHNVTIVCGVNPRSGLEMPSGRHLHEMTVDGLRVIQIGVSYRQQMSYPQRMLAFIMFMVVASWVVIRERDADVLFATSTPLTVAFPALVFHFLHRKPYIFEVRDLWPEAPIAMGVLRNKLLIALARLLERMAYRFATHIIALSSEMRDGIKATGVPDEKITVIPNCCDNMLFHVSPKVGAAFRQEHSYLDGRPIVVYAGTFGMANGLEYIVRLAKEVAQMAPQIAFVLVGDGSEKAKIVRLAGELQVLDQDLWVLPRMPRQEMPKLLSAATVAMSTFIPLPIVTQNSANKFFDALAAGRPIAINYQGWQAEVLQESGAGIVLPPEDIGRAARQLVDFMHSDDQLQWARKAARRLATEQFDRRRLALQLEELLLSAVKEGQPAQKTRTG